MFDILLQGKPFGFENREFDRKISQIYLVLQERLNFFSMTSFIGTF